MEEGEPILGVGCTSDLDDWNDATARSLPPMKVPDEKRLRKEYAVGVLLVEGLAITFLVVPLVLAEFVNWKPYTFWSTSTRLIIAVDLVALACHAGIMFSDPGEIVRGETTTLPIPKIVKERLRMGESLDDLGNIQSITDDGTDDEAPATYCVRCCVWRQAQCCQKQRQDCLAQRFIKKCPCCQPRPAHHCSVCQRCTAGFDHHCSALGRCIAEGNMRWFILILTMCQAAVITNLLCILVTIGEIWGAWPMTGAAVVVGGYYVVALSTSICCIGQRHSKKSKTMVAPD